MEDGGEEMGRTLRIVWEEDAARLLHLYQVEQDGLIRTRLHALWLLHAGNSVEQTAATLGVHYRTVQDWIAWYRQGGVTAVRAHHRGGQGRMAHLTGEQQSQLLEQAATGSFFTAQDAVEWVTEHFGVQYRPKGMYSLLRRLGCKKKVPRPKSTKTSTERQEAWKKGS